MARRGAAAAGGHALTKAPQDAGGRDFAVQQRLVLVRGGMAIAVSAVVLAASVLWLPRFVSLPSAPFDRLTLALQADLFVALWVVIAVRRVSSIRFRSSQDIAGSAYGEPSARIAPASAFLQNTLEQAFIAVLAHLALASLGGPGASAFVLAAVLLFAVGRIAFWVGYPAGAGGRAFGIVMTMTPTIAAFGWSIGLIVGRLF